VRQRHLPSFAVERQRFALRFTCEHCTYFHVERERCMHGYPNAEHREARYVSAADPSTRVDSADTEQALVFCIEFELI
jgi:hypothetical protein